jgi:hypothetical protein
MMNDLQKMGGIAALGVVASWVVSLGLLFILLIPTGYATRDIDYGQFVTFLADNQTIMYIWYLNILLGSVFVVVLALALYERLKTRSLAMVQTATAFGFLWGALGIASGLVWIYALDVVVDLFSKDQAQAASAWLMLDAVANGLGGEFEIMGGIWILLISWAALRIGGLPRALNYLGVMVGVAGILTIVTGLDVVLPALDVPETVFVLVIVWLVWLGIVMLRRSPSAAAEKPDAFVPRPRATTF